MLRFLNIYGYFKISPLFVVGRIFLVIIIKMFSEDERAPSLSSSDNRHYENPVYYICIVCFNAVVYAFVKRSIAINYHNKNFHHTCLCLLMFLFWCSADKRVAIVCKWAFSSFILCLFISHNGCCAHIHVHVLKYFSFLIIFWL